MIILRLLLLPFTGLYALVILLRNIFFRSGILTRTAFDIPVICVGNLAAGGTGKTPHIEWLISKLQHSYQIAVLSRGYKRKTYGYVFANRNATPDLIGDEPYQIKQKFKEIALGVSENRVLGIPDLLGDAPQTEVILMDDGYQHLALKASCYILLTDYNNLFTTDWLIPSGLLREFRSGYKRADLIIVTKCPPDLSASDKDKIIKDTKPLPHQRVLFSSIAYGNPQPVLNASSNISASTLVIPFSGIANPVPFENFIAAHFKTTVAKRFKDHHPYCEDDLIALRNSYNLTEGKDKILLCTEKDAVKLKTHPAVSQLDGLPLHYLPITIQIHDGQEEFVLQYLHDHVKKMAYERP